MNNMRRAIIAYVVLVLSGVGLACNSTSTSGEIDGCGELIYVDGGCVPVDAGEGGS